MKIGITTTIPVEVIFAAGCVPVDLNNIFITAADPGVLVRQAEENGLPRNLCSWVKGIFSTIINNPEIDRVIAVTEGDCTNTLAMLDLLSNRGVEMITFAYPYNRDRQALDASIAGLEREFGVTREMTGQWKRKLDLVRAKALRIDEMTWRENRFTGLENHLALISCSDFEGDPDKFEKKLDGLIREASTRRPRKDLHRIGFCGVPTIFSDLYKFLEEMGAGVVFNEMQRQFAMPGGTTDVVDQYLNYTYPYSYNRRMKDVREQVGLRGIEGVIHYIQSFCHHQIHDWSLKQALDCPVLTLEGDKPGPLLERSRIRIESFLEMMDM